MNKVMKGFVLVVAFLFVGCATRPAPTPLTAIHIDPDFHQLVSSKLYVLPIIDKRNDKSESADIEKKIRERCAAVLQKKGYDVVLLSEFGGNPNSTAESISRLSVDELYNFGPENAQSILFLYLNNVSTSYVVVQYTYTVEMTGLLLDKERKKVLWEGNGDVTMKYRGLASAAATGPITTSFVAAMAPVDKMLKTFPDRIDR